MGRFSRERGLAEAGGKPWSAGGVGLATDLSSLKRDGRGAEALPAGIGADHEEDGSPGGAGRSQHIIHGR